MSAGRPWVYLGKDAARRDAVALRRGPPRSLGTLVHDEARRLRGPFLDWAAGLGRGLDPEAWWAGTLAWKSWMASDLFLLAAYRAAAMRLAAQADAPDVVVEDPWLRALLAGNCAPRAPMLAAAALGLGRRFKWLWRAGRSALLHRRYAPKFPPPEARDGAVFLYTHLLDRNLAPGDRWEEFYIPGLPAELAAAGIPVPIVTYPEPYGRERALAARHAAVRPVILDARVGDFLSALFARGARPAAVPPLAGMDVSLLVEREHWHDLSRAGRCAYILFARAAARLLGAARWRCVVFPWEGQPQERLLVLAARAAGVPTVGYQHSTTPTLQLPFYLGKGEAEGAPWPDVIIVSGEHPRRVFAEGGVPPERMALGGSRRYTHLAQGQGPKPPLSEDVLVLLPIDPFQAEHLLSALARAYPKGGDDFRFFVKPHPAQGLRRGLRFPAEPVDGPLAPLLERFATVVFTGTTAGAEALSAGRRALRYRAETLLDIDPCEFLTADQLPTAGDADLKEKLDALRRAPPPDPAATRRGFAELFAPVDAGVWKRAIGVID